MKCKSDRHVDADKLVDGENFIDPGDQLSYKLVDKEDITLMKDIQKTQKRNSEADKSSDKRELLTSTSTVNVCRDVRIVERKGILYKDTSMWDEPKRRKGVLFE